MWAVSTITTGTEVHVACLEDFVASFTCERVGVKDKK